MPQKTLAQRLEALRNNRTSGALDLALQAIDLARDWLTAGHSPDHLARKLKAMHPAIATVRNVARVIAEETGDRLRRLQDVRQSLIEGNRHIAENLRPLIPSTATVITLSNSSTVREALIALEVGSVYVLESRPGGEGADMTEALQRGFSGRLLAGAEEESTPRVQLVPDAAMGNLVPESDCALVGIDTLDPTGAILHKVGTLPLALCCRHFRKPFYAAGHSFKFVEKEFRGLPEPGKPPEAQIFDRTPAELITALVSERRDWPEHTR